jgi:uncharacterized protein with ParB-like and HNH nuclease domain
MEVKFTPEHKVVNDLFAREIKYIIPGYQRPYSWECLGKSDRNNQINSMWDDLYGYFEDGKKETYFFGSMVLIGNGNREYQVVDGQQRLTSLVLLFAAFKCFAQEIVNSGLIDKELFEFSNKVISLIDELIFNEKLFGAVPMEKKVKIEKSAGFDFDNVLTKSINCESFDTRSYSGVKQEQLEIAERYFRNKDFFVDCLRKNFLDSSGQFTKETAKKLNQFLDFIKNRVSVVRILTEKFEVAYHIFEILNNRGLPLSNKDLFRNFLLKEFDALKKQGGQFANIEPSEKWATLEQNYDLRDDFLARWVESVNARQQQYSAFNDLKEIYERQYSNSLTKHKIEIFFDDIEQDLGYFTTIINADVVNPFLKAKLNVLLNGGNNRYTLNFLLALWRHSKGDEAVIYPLANAYEIFLMHKVLLGRFISGPVYEAINSLKRNDIASKTIAGLAPPVVCAAVKKEIIEGNLDNETGKLLISKWVWLQEAKTADDDLIDQKLLFDKASLEHIIPQKPDQGTNWLKEFSNNFRNDFTYQLGNMTLLTGRQNSAARNFDFTKKKVIYLKTKLALTQEIAHLPKIDENYLIDRHERIISEILQDLGI